MAYIGVGAVFIVLCSWIAVPSPVPFTLQTFGVFFVLGLLKGRRGFYSVAVYILMGLVGIPVFSGFTGGAGVFLGPTGGFIIGFAVAALFYRLVSSLFEDKLLVRVVLMFSGLLLCYALGTVWYAFVFASGEAGGFVSALTVCVVPFVIPDILKGAAAAVLSRSLEKRFTNRI